MSGEDSTILIKAKLRHKSGHQAPTNMSKTPGNLFARGNQTKPPPQPQSIACRRWPHIKPAPVNAIVPKEPLSNMDRCVRIFTSK